VLVQEVLVPKALVQEVLVPKALVLVLIDRYRVLQYNENRHQ